MPHATCLGSPEPSTPSLSPADIAAHRAASYVRPRLAVSVAPSANWTICPDCGGPLTPTHRCPNPTTQYHQEVEAAYRERDRQNTERRTYAMNVAADFAIDAYSLPNLPRSDGDR